MFLVTQETEELLKRLEEDHEKVEQVRTIVKAEEEVMQQETSVVQKYAEVISPLKFRTKCFFQN